MRAIYQPKGKAAEYGRYAVNLYTGCTHACKYCYVPRILRTPREDFHSGFKLREGILEQLDKDAARMPKGEPVFLSFTSDPYQPGAGETTRAALKILNKHGINFTILTKGGCRAVRDFDLYKKGDEFGVTLTDFGFPYNDPGREPYAADTEERLKSLKSAKFGWGIRTWASFEPVINPRVTISLLTRVSCDDSGVFFYNLVDHVKIGACSGNYSRVGDWKAFGAAAEKICRDYGVPYYLKKDLRRRMGRLFNDS